MYYILNILPLLNSIDIPELGIKIILTAETISIHYNIPEINVAWFFNKYSNYNIPDFPEFIKPRFDFLNHITKVNTENSLNTGNYYIMHPNYAFIYPWIINHIPFIIPIFGLILINILKISTIIVEILKSILRKIYIRIKNYVYIIFNYKKIIPSIVTKSYVEPTKPKDLKLKKPFNKKRKKFIKKSKYTTNELKWLQTLYVNNTNYIVSPVRIPFTSRYSRQRNYWIRNGYMENGWLHQTDRNGVVIDTFSPYTVRTRRALNNIIDSYDIIQNGFNDMYRLTREFSSFVNQYDITLHYDDQGSLRIDIPMHINIQNIASIQNRLLELDNTITQTLVNISRSLNTMHNSELILRNNPLYPQSYHQTLVREFQRIKSYLRSIGYVYPSSRE